MGDWGFRLEMPTLDSLKRELLDADMKYYSIEKRMEFMEEVEKFNNDRNMRVRLLNMLKKYNKSVEGVSDFMLSLKIASQFASDIMSYKIEDLEGITALEVRFSPVAVELMDMLKNMSGRFFGKVNMSKDMIKNKFLSELKKKYKTEATLKELTALPTF